MYGAEEWTRDTEPWKRTTRRPDERRGRRTEIEREAVGINLGTNSHGASGQTCLSLLVVTEHSMFVQYSKGTNFLGAIGGLKAVYHEGKRGQEPTTVSIATCNDPITASTLPDRG
jgi:hypothetical protein